MSASIDARTRRRRGLGFLAVALLLAADAYATGLFGGSERTLAIVRSIVLPGLPFLEWNLAIGIAAIAAALAALGAWLRWGVDWLPALVVAVCVCVAAFVMPLHHDGPEQSGPYPDPRPAHSHDHGDHHGASLFTLPREATQSPGSGAVLRGSHEFTVVLVVFALVARLRLMFGQLPGMAWVQDRLPAGMVFPAVDVARAAAVTLLAGADRQAVRERLTDPRLCARARRVDRWARFRFRGDPDRRGHAPLKAALALAGLLDPRQIAAFRTDARARLVGVPESEPTWVRPLDGMLAALALHALGETACVDRWRSTFDTRFALRHGRRAAALHAPSMLSLGTARNWEHAAATALGRHVGWLGDDDWRYLRPRCLGQAAGGAKDTDTLRLIAAGKLWATLTSDREALDILDRRGTGDDALARALTAIATNVREAKGPAGAFG